MWTLPYQGLIFNTYDSCPACWGKTEDHETLPTSRFFLDRIITPDASSSRQRKSQGYRLILLSYLGVAVGFLCVDANWALESLASWVGVIRMVYKTHRARRPSTTTYYLGHCPIRFIPTLLRRYYLTIVARTLNSRGADVALSPVSSAVQACCVEKRSA